MIETKTGTHFIDAFILSFLKTIVFLIEKRKSAAIIPPRTGETIQEDAIFSIVVQLTMPKPAAAIPAPITPPTIE